MDLLLHRTGPEADVCEIKFICPTVDSESCCGRETFDLLSDEMEGMKSAKPNFTLWQPFECYIIRQLRSPQLPLSTADENKKRKKMFAYVSQLSN